MEDTEIKKQRGQVLPLIALIKRAIISSLEMVFKKDLNVKLTNDKVFMSYFNNLSKNIGEVNKSIEKIHGFENEKKTSQSHNHNINQDLYNKIIAQIAEVKEQLNHMPAFLAELKGTLDKIADKNMVVNIPDFPKLEIPKIQRVSGNVKVDNPTDLTSLSRAMEKVERAIKDIDIPEQKQIVFPKIEFPKPLDTVEIKSGKDILKSLADVKKLLEELPKNISMPEMEFPASISIDNFPPQKYPTPPNNININPLRGVPLSTAVTVPTTPQALPSNPLAHRRTLIIFNNSSQTVYIGDSTVNASGGFPIPRGQYSPPIDAGPRMIIYGVSTSGTAEVRVLEVSNDNIGSE